MISDKQLDHIIRLNPQMELLRRVPIFRHLEEAALSDLARRMVIKRWQATALVVGQHEAGNSLFVVYHGQARVVLFGENGREITLSVLRAGDFFGDVSLIDGKPRSANVVAAEDSVFLVLDREAFVAHLRAHPQTALSLLQVMAGRLRRADELIGSLALHDVSARLTRTLISLAREQGEQSDEGWTIRNRPTQQDLANMVGTCRETVSRALTSLARQGLVISRGRHIVLRPALLGATKQAA
ncbi:MAG: Crp/Fnr family transcriptional regulator [Deltaproteobacteria bacterium]|nr:Crp/Fnr family transcriptional regulator [Deltaproteobacteria bacterium]